MYKHYGSLRGNSPFIYIKAYAILVIYRFHLHIIGEISRPISMTLRLFGNIMGEDVVILVLSVALFPLLVPLPMYIMALFTSLLQSLVFTILTGVYLSGALSDGH